MEILFLIYTIFFLGQLTLALAAQLKIERLYVKKHPTAGSLITVEKILELYLREINGIKYKINNKISTPVVLKNNTVILKSSSLYKSDLFSLALFLYTLEQVRIPERFFRKPDNFLGGIFIFQNIAFFLAIALNSWWLLFAANICALIINVLVLYISYNKEIFVDKVFYIATHVLLLDTVEKARTHHILKTLKQEIFFYPIIVLKKAFGFLFG